MSRAGDKLGGLLSTDYETLEKHVTNKKVYRLADVQDRIERVAFDVVRFRDSEGLEKLWVIQEQNGEQVIAAMYDDEVCKEASVQNWTTIPDNKGNVNIFYKNDPITRLAMSNLGIPEEDAASVSRYLPKKLSSDKTLTKALLNELHEKEREALFAKYPELKG